jgi:chorismate dehydratase
MSGSIRLAASAFTNSWPLTALLEDVRPGVERHFAPPSRLLEGVLSGETDAALLPVVHLFAHPELIPVSGLGVAADGPVKSVLLKFFSPLSGRVRLRRDPASATSNMLAHWLLREKVGARVEWSASGLVDGEVFIGDRALFAPPAPAGEWDLAAEWKICTGLPFVFAVWAMRADHPRIPEVEEVLRTAWLQGVTRREELLDDLIRRHGRSRSFWADYLEETIHYELSERDRSGMAAFRDAWVSLRE